MDAATAHETEGDTQTLEGDAEQYGNDGRTSHGSDGRSPGAGAQSIRADVVRLVHERRYEEALSVLYAARAESPKDREIASSIQQIKEFLAGAHAKRLGGLDRVAGPVPVSAGRSPDMLLVARYVDGTATFDDICRTCPLGRLRTLEILVELYAGPGPISPPSRELTASRLRRIEPAAEAPPAAHDPDAAVDTQRARVDPVAPVARAAPPTPRVETAPSRPAAPPSEPVLRVAPAPRVGIASPPPAAPPSEPVLHIAPTPWAEPAPPLPAPASSPEDAFREAFARGTAAFVQRRFNAAVAAFRECESLRPGDAGVAVMLRRSLAGGRS